MYNDLFIQRNLQNAEYRQLLDKGYFKLRIALDSDRLRMFHAEFRVGDEIILHAPDKSDVAVKISSVDTGEPSDNICKVFVGFTLI